MNKFEKLSARIDALSQIFESLSSSRDWYTETDADGNKIPPTENERYKIFYDAYTEVITNVEKLAGLK